MGEDISGNSSWQLSDNNMTAERFFQAIFCELPDLYPYSEGRSPYSLTICGKPLFEHIVERMAAVIPSGHLKIILHDKFLAQDEAVKDFIRHILGNPSKQANGSIVDIEGCQLFHSGYESRKFAMPWDLLEVMTEIIGRMRPARSADVVIEDNVAIDGNVILSSGTTICRGSILRGDVYIGPDCLIGYNSVIRGPCAIEANCRIGYSSEIKNAFIQPRTIIGPLCFVGDSIVGSGCSLGALTRTSNFKLDRKNIVSLWKNVQLDTGRTKLGAFIGHDVQIGNSVTILPGKRIGNNIHIYPNVLVDRHLSSGRRYFVEQNMNSIPLFGSIGT